MLILYSSIYPGQPAHALFWVRFWSLLLTMPLVVLLIVPTIRSWLWQFCHWLFSLQVCPKWLAIATPIIGGITWGLVQFNISQTLAFKVSRDAFEQVLDDVPASVTQVDTRLGLYNVERYSTDPRGGIYFRVRWEDAGLDIIHYGFSYQPNQHGSPFGEINYTLEHLTGDWYVFSETSPFQF